jgi:hypothetical protein
MDETAAKHEIEYTFLFLVGLQPATTATIVRCKTIYSDWLMYLSLMGLSPPTCLLKSEFHYNYKRRKKKVGMTA